MIIPITLYLYSASITTSGQHIKGGFCKEAPQNPVRRLLDMKQSYCILEIVMASQLAKAGHIM